MSLYRIGKLPENTTELDARCFFSQYGRVHMFKYFYCSKMGLNFKAAALKIDLDEPLTFESKEHYF